MRRTEYVPCPERDLPLAKQVPLLRKSTLVFRGVWITAVTVLLPNPPVPPVDDMFGFLAFASRRPAVVAVPCFRWVECTLVPILLIHPDPDVSRRVWTAGFAIGLPFLDSV